MKIIRKILFSLVIFSSFFSISILSINAEDNSINQGYETTYAFNIDGSVLPDGYGKFISKLHDLGDNYLRGYIKNIYSDYSDDFQNVYIFQYEKPIITANQELTQYALIKQEFVPIYKDDSLIGVRDGLFLKTQVVTIEETIDVEAFLYLKYYDRGKWHQTHIADSKYLYAYLNFDVPIDSILNIKCSWNMYTDFLLFFKKLDKFTANVTYSNLEVLEDGKNIYANVGSEESGFFQLGQQPSRYIASVYEDIFYLYKDYFEYLNDDYDWIIYLGEYTSIYAENVWLSEDEDITDFQIITMTYTYNDTVYSADQFYIREFNSKQDQELPGPDVDFEGELGDIIDGIIDGGNKDNESSSSSFWEKIVNGLQDAKESVSDLIVVRIIIVVAFIVLIIAVVLIIKRIFKKDHDKHG